MGLCSAAMQAYSTRLRLPRVAWSFSNGNGTVSMQMAVVPMPTGLARWFTAGLPTSRCSPRQSSGRTGPIASVNYAVVACQSSIQRSPPVHRRVSSACQDTQRFNRPCATTLSTPSVSPDSMSPPKLNPVEPPRYGPVCPLVWEGWHREVSPYPDQDQFCDIDGMS